MDCINLDILRTGDNSNWSELHAAAFSAEWHRDDAGRGGYEPETLKEIQDECLQSIRQFL